MHIRLNFHHPFLFQKIRKITCILIPLIFFIILVYKYTTPEKKIFGVVTENKNQKIREKSLHEYENIRRRNFCKKTKNDEYCRHKNPLKIDFEYIPIHNNGHKLNKMLEFTPIILMTSNRSKNVLKILPHILSLPGCIKSNIVIHTDKYDPTLIEIAKLFDIPLHYYKNKCNKLCAIASHYLESFNTTFNDFPKSEELIVIEDDLYISPDFFLFIASTVSYLRNDNKYYCISAWNDQSYKHTLGDPRTLFLTETMPGLGWVMKRSIFMNELKPSWKGKVNVLGWDIWMRQPNQRKNRECIVPAVSRTYHFCKTGTNVNKNFIERHLKSRMKFEKTNIEFNISWLEKNNYEDVMIEFIKNGEQFVDDYNTLLGLGEKAFNSLKLSSEPVYYEEKNFKNTKVVYIDTNNKKIATIWLKLARSWKIWDLDERGFHNSAIRIWLSGIHYIIIFCPSSTYCRYKPSNVNFLRPL